MTTLAVAKVGGHQAIVKVGDTLQIDKLSAEPGKKVSFEVLLVSEEDGSKCQIGNPFVAGTTVEAKVIEHGRGDKVRVFKMKPRKRYRRSMGHRQDYSLIEITSIKTGSTGGAKKEVKEGGTKETAKKTSSAKKAPAKKPATKKPAAKAKK